jgi:hypothetical protein
VFICSFQESPLSWKIMFEIQLLEGRRPGIA